MMRPLAILGMLLLALLGARSADAHPSPFSYVDLRIAGDRLEVTLVVHIFDVAHDLPIDPPDRLFDAATLSERSATISAMLSGRLRLTVDGVALPPPEWGGIIALPERQSLQMRAGYPLTGAPGVIAIETAMFPYDIAHQTFVNVYETGSLRLQAILDASRTRLEYFAGSRQGVIAVVRQFVRSGATHILASPDHLIFLAALILLGGTMLRLGLMVTAFTLTHTAVLTAAAFGTINPPARLVEPAIALSIIYVGVDNLLVRGGRDMRLWIAAAFGVLHAFGLAAPMRSLDLPRAAFSWSLLSFNVGVEIAQLIVVLLLGGAMLALHRRFPGRARSVAVAGSVIVACVGVYWFIERVFFPGGIA